MLVLGVVLYLLLVSLALAFLLLPEVRSRVMSRMTMALAGARSACAIGRQGSRQQLQQWGVPITTFWGDTHSVMRRHARPLGLGLLVLVSIPAGVIVLRQAHTFEGYDHTASTEVNPRVTALLAGEQLAAPAALPPELFMAREVEQAYPMAQGASRQWELLDADFRQRVLLAFKIMREQHGYEMALIEGYRSPERQAQLAAAGPQVTQAGAFESYHQYGLAADCAFLRGGKLVISEQDPWAAQGYALYGEVSRSLGLVWGGSWHQLRDLGHIELRRQGVLRKG